MSHFQADPNDSELALVILDMTEPAIKEELVIVIFYPFKLCSLPIF